MQGNSTRTLDRKKTDNPFLFEPPYAVFVQQEVQVGECLKGSR